MEDFRDTSMPLQDMDCHILCAGSLLVLHKTDMVLDFTLRSTGRDRVCYIIRILFVPPSHEDKVSPEPAHFHMRLGTCVEVGWLVKIAFE